MSKHDQFLAKAGKLASLGLAFGGMLAVSAFFYFFYRYSWSGQRHFTGAMNVALYYGGPLALALLLFASLKLKAIHKVNLLVMFGALAASLYGVELLLQSRFSPLPAPRLPAMNLLARAKDKKKYAADLTRKFGNEIDIRTPVEVLEDFRKKNIDAVPIVTPSNYLFVREPDGSIKSALSIDGQEVMPLAGVSNKVTLLCNENGQWIDYRSDARGFNNSDEAWQPDNVEIAALGDSFTHGYCVPKGANFVDLIGQRHPGILNLGIAGDGPLLMLAKLKEYLPSLRPKTVLWFYYEGNDLTDLQVERKSALLLNYLKDDFSQKELAQQSDIDRAILDEIARRNTVEAAGTDAARRAAAVSEVADFAKLTALRQSLGLGGGLDAETVKMGEDLEGPNMEVFRNIMVQAQTRVSSWGGKLYFVYLPEWGRYSDSSTWGIKKQAEILSFVRGLGIPVVDIDSAFRAHGDPLSLFPFRGLGHYTETGHRVVADEVLRCLAGE